MMKHPSEWTDEERWKVARAIEEHRLNRVDLYVWQEAEIASRNTYDLALEFYMTSSEMEGRIAIAKERLQSTFDRPSQEAYLGRWLNT